MTRAHAAGPGLGAYLEAVPKLFCLVAGVLHRGLVSALTPRGLNLHRGGGRGMRGGADGRGGRGAWGRSRRRDRGEGGIRTGGVPPPYLPPPRTAGGGAGLRGGARGHSGPPPGRRPGFFKRETSDPSSPSPSPSPSPIGPERIGLGLRPSAWARARARRIGSFRSDGGRPPTLPPPAADVGGRGRTPGQNGAIQTGGVPPPTSPRRGRRVEGRSPGRGEGPFRRGASPHPTSPRRGRRVEEPELPPGLLHPPSAAGGGRVGGRSPVWMASFRSPATKPRAPSARQRGMRSDEQLSFRRDLRANLTTPERSRARRARLSPPDRWRRAPVRPQSG